MGYLGAKKVVNLKDKPIKAMSKVNKTDIEWIHSDNAIEFKGDLVVANILSSALKIDAYFIIDKNNLPIDLRLGTENEIKEIYSTWFDFEDSIIKNGWVCISASKR